LLLSFPGPGLKLFHAKSTIDQARKGQIKASSDIRSIPKESSGGEKMMEWIGLALALALALALRSIHMVFYFSYSQHTKDEDFIL